jgi:hypothetical protein
MIAACNAMNLAIRYLYEKTTFTKYHTKLNEQVVQKSVFI